MRFELLDGICESCLEEESDMCFAGLVCCASGSDRSGCVHGQGKSGHHSKSVALV